jgi:hypothetical protein
MRKLLVFLLFFLAAFSVFAQTRVTREPKVFVPLIGGSGDQADIDFFYHKLTYELVLQYNELARRRNISDYTLTGTIVPIDEFTFEEEFVKVTSTDNPVPDFPTPPVRNIKGNREFFSWETNDGAIYFYDTTSEEEFAPVDTPAERPVSTLNSSQYPSGSKVFVLELTDSITGAMQARQYVVYLDTDASTGEVLAFAVNSMLSSLPDVVEYEDWRDKWLFVGAGLIWAAYSADGSTANYMNFGFRASAEFQAFKYVSFDLGLQVLYDMDYEYLLLGIPLAVKLVLKPQNNLLLEPYLGVSMNHSLNKDVDPSRYSWFFGCQAGFKMGSGMLVFDPRFLSDFDNSSMKMVQIGLGYKFGFFQKTAVRPGR